MVVKNIVFQHHQCFDLLSDGHVQTITKLQPELLQYDYQSYAYIHKYDYNRGTIIVVLQKVRLILFQKTNMAENA